MDHNSLLDSPFIIRCELNGKNCAVITVTGMHPLSQIVLKPDSNFNRLLYSTSTGIWSRSVINQKNLNQIISSYIVNENINVLDKNYLKNSNLLLEDDLKHHLTLEDNYDINDIIPIDESLMFVVTTSSSLNG